MTSSLEAEIRDRLARYLAGEASLEEFDEWFVPATWDMDKTGDRAAAELTWEIVLRLAEYSNGDCTEAELKELLRPLVVPRAASVASA